MRLTTRLSTALTVLGLALSARAQAPAQPPPDESVLGEFVVTGTQQERLPRIAILPSLSPDLEDVIVRGVVRRDFELTGLFEVIPDSKAPPGLYGFDDPIDVPAWKKLGAEAIVKVAARADKTPGKIQVLGIAYFLNVGQEPVYQKTIVVNKSEARVTGHRITDALLGALTGRPGGFASEFTFSARWGNNRRVFRMDSDGNGLTPLSDPGDHSIAPTWGPNHSLYYLLSKQYAPYALHVFSMGTHKPVQLPFKTSLYGVAFDKTFTRMALAVSENGRSAIYVGNPDGTSMKRVSTTELATHPVFSPSGKLAWVGGDAEGMQRIFVDNKPVSPAGFTAAAPTFCDTEDGIRLVYSVQVGGDRQDLVASNEDGRNIARLTQGQGSNTSPACSPDGRLLAFFSTRNKQPGVYLMSLKRFSTQQISSQMGEGLRWAALPPVANAP
ncbi:MAG: tolB protein [Pseudomonadota bacterium]|nr:MAG: tolB protein [Pseudomonadota bacterium]